jgi:hypothetical protein
MPSYNQGSSGTPGHHRALSDANAKQTAYHIDVLEGRIAYPAHNSECATPNASTTKALTLKAWTELMMLLMVKMMMMMMHRQYTCKYVFIILFKQN